MSQTPMDFSYDNGTGPIDGRSPFAQVGHNIQRFPSSAMSSPSKRSMHGNRGLGSGRPLTGGKAEAQNGFDSPTKQRTMGALPSTPSRQGAAFNSLFTTPRTQRQMDIDDSSAGETPRSPDRDADSEATPEIKKKDSRSAKPKLDMNSAPTLAGAERTERNSPTKEKKERPQQPERRDSWFGSIASKMKNKLSSPNRNSDMILRSENPSRVEKSVSRRRKREVDRVHRRKRRHSMSDSEADGDYVPSSPRKGSSGSQQQHPNMMEKEPHWMRNLFTFIADHPTVPQILSFYAQLAFNFFLLAFCAYMVYCFWSAISADVDKKVLEAAAEIIRKQAICAKEWDENRCEPATRVRQLESFCEGLTKCLDQDPYKVGRAQVSASTFAGIFNSFVEPISYKAMAFTLILVFGCFAVCHPSPTTLSPSPYNRPQTP